MKTNAEHLPTIAELNARVEAAQAKLEASLQECSKVQKEILRAVEHRIAQAKIEEARKNIIQSSRV